MNWQREIKPTIFSIFIIAFSMRIFEVIFTINIFIYKRSESWFEPSNTESHPKLAHCFLNKLEISNNNNNKCQDMEHVYRIIIITAIYNHLFICKLSRSVHQIIINNILTILYDKHPSRTFSDCV